MTGWKWGAVVALGLGLGLSGCTVKSGFGSAATLNVTSDGPTVWNRPVEVGYALIGDVQGVAEQRTVFGITMGTATTGAVDIMGSLFGRGDGAEKVDRLDPLVQYAAYDAIRETGADAIYITRYEKEVTSALFSTFSKVTVYGKGLKMTELGTVSERRIDQWRFPTERRVIVTPSGSGTQAQPVIPLE